MENIKLQSDLMDTSNFENVEFSSQPKLEPRAKKSKRTRNCENDEEKTDLSPDHAWIKSQTKR